PGCSPGATPGAAAGRATRIDAEEGGGGGAWRIAAGESFCFEGGARADRKRRAVNGGGRHWIGAIGGVENLAARGGGAESHLLGGSVGSAGGRNDGSGSGGLDGSAAGTKKESTGHAITG